jgi:arylsulfatase A-like enzyme
LKNPSASTDFPVIGTDFYPTILDLVGVGLRPEQHIDGISLKPILEGKELDMDRPLYWHYPHYGNQGGNPSSIIRMGKWKLIHYWENDQDELYDLNKDIGEQSNVAEDYPEITTQMRKNLLGWLTEVGANLPEIDMQFNSVKANHRYQQAVNSLLPTLEEKRLEILSKDFNPNSDWWGSQMTKD